MDDGQGRMIISGFHLWPWRRGATPEMEAASAADPEAREAWDRVIAQGMPPATAWVQERWEIRFMPSPLRLNTVRKSFLGQIKSEKET
ncbi:hypothetical protein LZ31DRAFT_33871 [Colletotrichum somersetense]|nr:hypothetical protein LZ31DRAFT_33871 [Colletotrichum somersetense]